MKRSGDGTLGVELIEAVTREDCQSRMVEMKLSGQAQRSP